jgi:hypothetical protein
MKDLAAVRCAGSSLLIANCSFFWGRDAGFIWDVGRGSGAGRAMLYRNFVCLAAYSTVPGTKFISNGVLPSVGFCDRIVV